MENLVRGRGRRGLAIVEAAIFFPVLFLLLFGMVEYGWAFLKFQCINNAAREGVRVAVRDGATTAHWQAAVLNVMNDCSNPVVDYDASLEDSAGTPISVGVDPGTQITCEVTVDYDDIDLGQISLFPMPATLTGTATMVKEGPITSGP